MSDRSLMTEHRRLTILRHLESSGRHTSNSSILLDVCLGVGIQTTSDQMTAAVDWLEEMELVEVSGSSEFIIVTGTERGMEVARGDVRIKGVKVPTARR